MWRYFPSPKNFSGSTTVIQKSDTQRPIIIYILVFEEVISAALVYEVEKEEQLIYFIDRILHGTEVRYQMIEKVSLTLVITARRMQMYFQNHHFIVKTNYPIMRILAKPHLAGWMIGWAVDLSEFEIWYQPRGAIKLMWVESSIDTFQNMKTTI